MRKTGLLILVGSVLATLTTLALWFAGVVFGFGGALIHLLLVVALTVGPLGLALGLVLLLLGPRLPGGER